MKANELRIGSLVYFVHPDKGKQPSSIEKIESEAHLNWNGSDSIITVANGISYFDCDKNQLSGIPLSEETLLKCGFEKYGIWFRINNFNVSIGHNIAFEKWVTPYKTPIYLHQLQNLYFALTGNELDTSKLL